MLEIFFSNFKILFFIVRLCGVLLFIFFLKNRKTEQGGTRIMAIVMKYCAITNLFLLIFVNRFSCPNLKLCFSILHFSKFGSLSIPEKQENRTRWTKVHRNRNEVLCDCSFFSWSFVNWFVKHFFFSLKLCFEFFNFSKFCFFFYSCELGNTIKVNQTLLQL